MTKQTSDEQALRAWIDQQLDVHDWEESAGGPMATICCPLHDDHQPSASAWARTGTWSCSVCLPKGRDATLTGLAEQLGKKPPEVAYKSSLGTPMADYEFHSRDGRVIGGEFRFPPNEKEDKPIRPYRVELGPNGLLKKRVGMDSVLRHTPYHMHKISDLDASALVAIVEGAKDADTLIHMGWPATTNAGGAGQWTRKHSAALPVGPRYLLFPDADTPGLRHMAGVGKSLLEAGHEQVYAVPPETLGLAIRPDHGEDISDWLPKSGDGFEQLGRTEAIPYKDWLEYESMQDIEPDTVTEIFSAKDDLSLLAILRIEGLTLRYNTRSDCVEVARQGQETDLSGWSMLGPTEAAQFRFKIAREYRYRGYRDKETALLFGQDAWNQAVLAAAGYNVYDPFQGFLEQSLPTWDGTRRIDTLLMDLFGAPDTPLNRWISRVLWIGPIERIYRPGCKIDEVPVLVGRQGVGKSSFFRAMLPPEADGWFSDGLRLSSSDKEKVEALQSCVIAEIGEMAGSTRAELSSMKAFLTRRDDGSVRKAYRRDPLPTPRRCYIVGSADNTQSLPNDPAGNRRFLVCQLTRGADIEGTLPKIYRECWAEALQYWRDSDQGQTVSTEEPWRGKSLASLPRHLFEARDALNRTHTSSDEWVESRVETLDKATTYTFAQAVDAMDLGSSMGTGMTARVSKALVKGGWVKKHMRDGNHWRHESPLGPA